MVLATEAPSSNKITYMTWETICDTNKYTIVMLILIQQIYDYYKL